MNIDVYDAQGQILRQVDIPDGVFGVEVKDHLLYEVVRYQLARRRQGTAHTKNRSAVRGGGRKPWRQKGTGPARDLGARHCGGAGGQSLVLCPARMPTACRRRNAVPHFVAL